MEDQDIKDKILKGSEELFMKYGVRSISMDDVARHLSISKKTIYHHFVDKDEIVMKVSQAHCDRNLIESDSISASAENAIDELDGGLKAQLASLADEIRSSEETLIRTKEGYLKVQGAIEILAILKQKVSAEENNKLADALTDPLAE